MSLLFWRDDQGDQEDKKKAIAVNKQTPLPVRPYNTDEENFKVEIDQFILPPLAGNTIYRQVTIPGIAAAAAYADGDAFGTQITFGDVFRVEKNSGTVVGILFFDKDDEGLNKDCAFFAQTITQTADNDAFGVSDDDLVLSRGVVAISTWYNWGNNQLGVAKDVGLWVKSNSTNLVCQVITRGVDNIAAGAIPQIAILVVPD